MAYKNFKSTEIIDEIGAELRKIRISKNLTINFVAEKLSETGFPISNTLLGRVETGERRIDDDSLKAICSFYNVDPNSVVITACEEHMKRLSASNDGPAADTEDLSIMFERLNSNGKDEISRLMQLMAYMNAFKAK